jgi:hypothetical protein
MDYTAALTHDEVAALSDPECSWQDALQRMKANGPFALDDFAEEDSGRRFGECLRLKNALDDFEELGTSNTHVLYSLERIPISIGESIC